MFVSPCQLHLYRLEGQIARTLLIYGYSQVLIAWQPVKGTEVT